MNTRALVLPFATSVVLSCGPATVHHTDDPNDIVAISAQATDGMGGGMCGLTRGGTVRCRMSGEFFAHQPVESGATALAAAGDEGCSLDAQQHVTCWEREGASMVVSSDTAHTVTELQVTRSVGLMNGCGIVDGGLRMCWLFRPAVDLSMAQPVTGTGRYPENQYFLGNNVSATIHPDGQGFIVGGPIFAGVVDFAGDAGWWCFRRTDGHLLCRVQGSDPAPMPLFDELTDLVLRDSFMCGRRADRTVRCFGRNDHGQLGDGTTTDAMDHLVEPVGLGPVDGLASDRYMTCALVGVELRCWGSWVENGSGMRVSHVTPTAFSLTLP